MVDKKTDIRKPSKTGSSRAPKEKAAQSGKKCLICHTPKNKKIDKESKTKISELERFASFPLLNPNPVLEVNSSGQIIFINNAAKDILRKLKLGEEGEVFLPRDINTILRGLNYKKGKEFHREITIQDRVFGETLYLAPEYKAVRIYAHDITRRKRVEKEIRRAEISLNRERDFTSAVLSTTGALVIVLDLKGRIVSFNKMCERITGYSFNEIRDKAFWDIFLIPEEIEPVKSVFKELKTGQFPNKHENYWVAKDGTRFLISWSNTALFNTQGEVEFIIGTGIDVTDHKRAEDALRHALNESKQRQAEISALLKGSSAVLRYNNFKDAAEAIFNSCKNLIGAASGYIAMVSHDGTRNEVIYLDSGGLTCSVDPDLPMPIRGMRGEVYGSGNAIYNNEFPHSGWKHFLPEGHVQLENVLMAPMIIENKVIGLFGLGNKVGGFTDNDVRVASAFSEFAAIALVQKRAEEELREAEDSLQKANRELENKVHERTKEIMAKADLIDALFTYTMTPLALLDRDFNFLRVNQQYAQVCSMEINNFPGHNHFEFYPQEENESIFRGVVQTKTPYHAVAKPFIFPDHPEWGVTYWDWTLTPLLDQKGEVNFLVFSLNNVTERKKAEDDLKASQEKLRDLYAHLQLAVEAERTKIAREIHDEFGTILTALNIDLSWLEKKIPEDQHTLKERIKKDMEFINSAVKIVQRISSELRPGVLDYLGFSSAVEWQVKEFGNRTGIDWDISVDVKTSEPDKDISIALFRILQESLTNIARYAEASKIKVNLAETDGILTLEVTDDGKGITEEQLSDPRSFGILGIRERIQYLNGDTDIKGIPNKGTTVRVRVPIAKEGCKK